MEDESLKVLEKPNRVPDYVTVYGSAYWWEEMIYLGAGGKLERIYKDQETGQLYMQDNKSNTAYASLFKRPFSPMIQGEYNKWWYEVFESKFMGETND